MIASAHTASQWPKPAYHVTSFPPWTIMLALPQSDLFIAQHSIELVTYYPS